VPDSETERAAGIALGEGYGGTPSLTVDKHVEPVATALDAANGARELVRLHVSEPNSRGIRAVDVRRVVARLGAERSHMRLHLLASRLLLRVLAGAAGGDKAERRQ
jgi:hypothetical protein